MIFKDLDVRGADRPLDESDYHAAISDALQGYDLDHTVDLQLGGKNQRITNMQWLQKSINRSVGVQLRNHRYNPKNGKGIFEPSINGEGGTPIDAFEINPIARR